jgi:hypothetical protein
VNKGFVPEEKLFIADEIAKYLEKLMVYKEKGCARVNLRVMHTFSRHTMRGNKSCFGKKPPVECWLR